MNIFELLAILLVVIGTIVGAFLGAQYAWWAAIVGLPVGAMVGLMAHAIVSSVMTMIALGPREFCTKALPAKSTETETEKKAAQPGATDNLDGA